MTNKEVIIEVMSLLRRGKIDASTMNGDVMKMILPEELLHIPIGNRRRPQDDVPTERVLKYLVKDYKRMFNTFDAMQRRAEKAEAKVEEMKEKNSKHLSHIESLRKGFDKNLGEVRASRDAVVKAATEDLEKRLKASNNKINLLLQALQDPNVVYEINAHTLNLDEDKEWMEKAMKQLEKAEFNFVSISARLSECEVALEGVTDSIEKKGIMSKINKAFTKIDSCVSHIEDFFKKVGNIKIEEDGKDYQD